MAGRRTRVSKSARRAAAGRKKNNLKWYGGLAGIGGIALIIVIVLALGQSSSGGAQSAQTDDGSAPDFEFTLYQGANKLGAETLDFSRLRGKPVVLNFWAGLCPPCRAEMPGFQKFYEDARQDVTLVGVDIGPFMRLGSHRDARNLLEELNISYPAGFTNQGRVVREYGIVSMPTTVFVRADGTIFETWSGFLDTTTLSQLVDAMLKDVPPESAS